MINEWTAVGDKNPCENGKYLVTVINKNLDKQVATSKYKDGRWANPYVIAWMTLLPYQGDSHAEENIKKTRTNKAAIMKRRERAFNLRISGLSYKKIAEEMGVSLSVATHDVQNYLYRKGEKHKCFSCVNAIPNTESRFLHYEEVCRTEWRCKLIKADVSYGCGCHEYLCAEGRIYCKNCRHNIGVEGRWIDNVRCEIHNRTSEENTCNDAQK